MSRQNVAGLLQRQMPGARSSKLVDSAYSGSHKEKYPKSTASLRLSRRGPTVAP